MAKHEELTGELKKIKQVFDEPPNQTVVIEFMNGTLAIGKASPDDFEYEMSYLLRGFWQTHPRWGRQFKFYSYSIAQPAGQRGTVAYLQRGPGIGRARALAIWNLYGQDALATLRERPDDVAAKVSGLTPERAREAAAYFQGHVDREIVTRDLEELLSGGGFPKKLIDRLIERFGARAAQVVRENIYILMNFAGVGFGKADKLYLALGGDPTNPERLGWCAQHALASDREGNTWTRPSVAIKAIDKSVAGVAVDAPTGIKWALDHNIIVQRVDERGVQWIAEAGRAAAEARLANHVHRAMAESTNP